MIGLLDRKDCRFQGGRGNGGQGVYWWVLAWPDPARIAGVDRIARRPKIDLRRYFSPDLESLCLGQEPLPGAVSRPWQGAARACEEFQRARSHQSAYG